MKLTATAVAICMAATSAQAGGPVIVEDPAPVVQERPTSSVGVLPLLLIPIILCVALCGGDDARREEPEPCGKTGGGCG